MSRKKKTKPQYITVGRYSEEVWKKLIPGVEEEDWEDIQAPHSISDYIFNFLDRLEDSENIDTSEVQAVTMVTYDEEYLKYLEDTRQEDSEQARLAYMPSDEELERLLVKNHFNRDYHFMALAASVFYTKPASISEVSLSEATKAKIHEYLNNVFGEDNVWFPGYILNCDSLDKDFRRILHIGTEYFDNGSRIRLMSHEKELISATEEDTLTVEFLFLPFMVKGSLHSAKVDLCALMEERNRYDFPDEHVIDFLGAGIEKMTQKDFQADLVSFFTSPIFADEAAEFVSFSIESLEAMSIEE